MSSTSSSASSNLAQKAQKFQQKKQQKQHSMEEELKAAFRAQRVEHGLDLDEKGQELLSEPGVLKGTPAQTAEARELAAMAWSHVLTEEVSRGHFHLPVPDVSEHTLRTMNYGLVNLLRRRFFVKRCDVAIVDGGLNVDIVLCPFLQGGQGGR